MNKLHEKITKLEQENKLLREKVTILSRLLPSAVDNYTPFQDSVSEDVVHHAGCNCESVLLGYRIGKGPRCRLCNTEAQIIY